MTLEDVASRAEVSLATASRVLNAHSGRAVSEALRQRVVAAAEELRYTPNAHARALAGAATSTVGVVAHDVGDPYFATIARGAMRAAGEQGLLVMLASTFRDPQREVAYVSALRAQRARAILLIGSGFEDRTYTRTMNAELRPYRKAGGRVAVVSHHDLPVDAVLPDNHGGAAAMARALVKLGHRELAVIRGPSQLTTVAHRLDGVREALDESGVHLDDDRIVDGDFTRDSGYAATVELLRRGLRASAIFCLNDVMAVGALAALRDHGLAVPEDVSLAGFDDLSIAGDLTPPLSTVRLPLEEIGERVMALALDERPSRRTRVERVGGEIVLRDSTIAPKRPTEAAPSSPSESAS